jgi:Winged helix DNA-binding domain
MGTVRLMSRVSRGAAPVAGPRLDVTREQIIAFRRRTGALDERLPPGPASLGRAAWAGLQDSVPRSALHSLHARVGATAPDAWEDPSLVQVWGLRYTAYVVPAGDHAPFTLGRLPHDGRTRRVAEDLAARLHAYLQGRRFDANDAGRGLGIHPNALRYAAMTGTVLIRWDGARRPTVWTVPRPELEPLAARIELARRYLRTFGPATPGSFATWAGIKPRAALAAFDAHGPSLVTVRTPIGEAFVLASDEPMLRAPAGPPASARLLPSGDPFYLLQGVDRELLVPDPGHRAALWTPRVWPGALLVGGDVAGTWRRSGAVVTVQPWRRLSREERDAVEVEAATLPLPEVHGAVAVRWEID